MYEELEPIDNNLKYDFDYQQFTHLKHEVLIKPVSLMLFSIQLKIIMIFFVYLQGDIVQLKCFYRTAGVDKVTFVSMFYDLCI